jgi:hypothetical protein
MAAEPAFDIPARPTRRYPGPGGLEYEGGTRFGLEPASEPARPLRALVEALLEAGPYRYGDFLELPMPLYLVRDDETGDVFRVSVRDGTVWLHVLPETDPPGLRAFYDRLREASACEWSVAREVED